MTMIIKHTFASPEGEAREKQKKKAQELSDALADTYISEGKVSKYLSLLEEISPNFYKTKITTQTQEENILLLVVEVRKHLWNKFSIDSLVKDYQVTNRGDDNTQITNSEDDSSVDSKVKYTQVTNSGDDFWYLAINRLKKIADEVVAHRTVSTAKYDVGEINSSYKEGLNKGIFKKIEPLERLLKEYSSVIDDKEWYPMGEYFSVHKDLIKKVKDSEDLYNPAPKGSADNGKLLKF